MTTSLRPVALSLSELTTLVRSVADDSALWQSRVRIPDGAQRWWTRLSSDSRVDVWLLTWLPGQNTDLHDHGDSAAAFSVVRGRLIEVRSDRAGHRTSYPRSPGSTTWVAPGVVHDVHGAGSKPAVSIHAYSPPLREMTYYESGLDGRLSVARTVRTDEPEQELQR